MKKLFLIFSISFVFHTVQAQSFNTSRMDSMFSALESNDKFMGSFAFSHKGNVLYSKTVGFADIEKNKKANEATKYRIGSISKMFTTVLIFKSIEAKQIKLDQTINTFFPNVINADKITIQSLLSHRSGIHNFTNSEDYLTYNTKAQTRAEMLHRIENSVSDFEPNSEANYSNSNFILLTLILEELNDKDYSAMVESEIVKPLGLKNTYVGGKIEIDNNESQSYKYLGKWEKVPETDMSIPLGAGAVVSNPIDLLKFIDALYSNKIVSENSLKSMMTIKDGYGMGMFQYPYNDDKHYGHTGGIDGFVSFLAYSPKDEVSISYTSNGSNTDANQISLCAMSAFKGTHYSIPSFHNLSLENVDLSQYTGLYATEEIPLKITISIVNNSLVAQATGQSAFPLEYSDEDTFSFEQAGVKLKFNPAEKTMTLFQGGKELLFNME